MTEFDVILEPLLVPHAEYYSGMTVQLHIVQPDTGITSLVAVGAPCGLCVLANVSCLCKLLRLKRSTYARAAADHSFMRFAICA